MKKCFNCMLAIFFSICMVVTFPVDANDCPVSNIAEMNTGRCSFTKMCLWDHGTHSNPCDPTAPNQGGGGSLPPGGGDDSLDPVNP